MHNKPNSLKIDKNNRIIYYFFFIIYFFFGLLTYKDYGVNIEEHTQLYSGVYWLNYVAEFFNLDFFLNYTSQYLKEFDDVDSLPDPSFYTYGPVFDIPTAFLDIIFNIEKSEFSFKFRHLLLFSIFYISSVVVFKILIERFNNFFVSFFGTMLYIFSPRIYGDSFHNNKDILFLSLVVFSIYYSFRIFKKKKLKNIILFALFSSMATSTRVAGLFLICSLILFLFLENLNSKDKTYHKIIVVSLILFFLFLYFHWPYMWENPLHSFIEYLNKTKIWIWKMGFLFNGEYIFSTSVPDYFIFLWVGISSPILNLILFIFGIFFISKRFFLRFLYVDKKVLSKYDFWRNKNEMKDVYIFFVLVTILTLLIFLNVPMANAWRHLYFLNFFIIYIATYFMMILSLRFRKYKFWFFIFYFFLIPSIYKIIIFHPYQSLYINELLTNQKKNSFQIDREGISRLESIFKIVSIENDKEKQINIANASYLPYYRINDALPNKIKKRVNFVGQEYDIADYIYDNFVYEVDPKYNKKYNIPKNFEKVYELSINGVKIYKIYKKNNL